MNLPKKDLKRLQKLLKSFQPIKISCSIMEIRDVLKCGDCKHFKGECFNRAADRMDSACPRFIPIGDLKFRGGVVSDFVYEPLGNGCYAYKYGDMRGVARLQPEHEEDEKGERTKKIKSWCLDLGSSEFLSIKFEDQPKPHVESFLKKLPFATPSLEDVEPWARGIYKSRPITEIAKELEAYVRVVLDLEDAGYQAKITALFIMQTWLRQILQTVFNLDVGGEFGGGKTTALEAINEVCYHPILASTSAANLARMNDKYLPSWLLDEYDKSRSNLSDTFIRQGYRLGVFVYRHNPETGKEEWFNPFGPKIISYHQELETALATRSIAHLSMTVSPDYRLPIINAVRQVWSRIIFRDLFFWYMDNIAEIKRRYDETYQHLVTNFPNLPTCPTAYTDKAMEEKIEEARAIIYREAVKEFSSEEQTFLKQFTGRPVELGYWAIVIIRILGLGGLIQELTEALETKVETEESQEFDLKTVLGDLILELHTAGKTETPKTELYKLAKERCQTFSYDLGTKEYGAALRDLGFRDRKQTVKRIYDPLTKRKGPRILVFTPNIMDRIRKSALSDMDAGQVGNQGKLDSNPSQPAIETPSEKSLVPTLEPLDQHTPLGLKFPLKKQIKESGNEPNKALRLSGIRKEICHTCYVKKYQPMVKAGHARLLRSLTREEKSTGVKCKDCSNPADMEVEV